MNFHLNRAFALSAVCLAVAFATAPARASNSGTLTLYSDYIDNNPAGTAPYSYSGGGAFTANFDSGSLTDSSYSPLAQGPLDSADFETFCLETTIPFSVQTPYNYSVGLSLQQTDSNLFPPTYGPNGTSDLADTGLSVGVAYLYQQYATGALASDLAAYELANSLPSTTFSYTDTGGTSGQTGTGAISAGALQAALWDLENQNPAINSPSTTLTTDLVDLAESNTGGTLADAQSLVTLSNGTDSWDVYVLELTNSSGQAVQDQLYYSTSVRVPDGGSTIALLGAALMALALFYRRAVLQV